MASNLDIFISYSHKDEDMRLTLGAFLKPLEREIYQCSWFDGRIEAGQDID